MHSKTYTEATELLRSHISATSICLLNSCTPRLYLDCNHNACDPRKTRICVDNELSSLKLKSIISDLYGRSLVLVWCLVCPRGSLRVSLVSLDIDVCAEPWWCADARGCAWLGRCERVAVYCSPCGIDRAVPIYDTRVIPIVFHIAFLQCYTRSLSVISHARVISVYEVSLNFSS